MAFDFALLRAGGQSIAAAAKAGTGGMSQPAHVSIKNQRWTLVDDQGNETPMQSLHLDVVIVGANPTISRVYYAGPYTDDRRAPDCFSDNGVAPSEEAQNPQNPTCQGCPQAVWGSATGVSGKGVPACRSKKKLALIVGGTLYQFAVPPGSLGNFGEYAKKFIDNPEVTLNSVITRLEFDPKQQGVINFAGIGYLENETDGKLAYDVMQKPSLLTRLLSLDDKPRTASIAGPRLIAHEAAETAREAREPEVPKLDKKQEELVEEFKAAAPRKERKPRATKAEMAARAAPVETAIEVAGMQEPKVVGTAELFDALKFAND